MKSNTKKTASIISPELERALFNVGASIEYTKIYARAGAETAEAIQKIASELQVTSNNSTKTATRLGIVSIIVASMAVVVTIISLFKN